MASGDGEISFKVYLQVPNQWLLVHVDVPGLRVLQMVLDTGSAKSSISDRVRNELKAVGLLHATGKVYRGSPFFLLTGLNAKVTPFPILTFWSVLRLHIIGLTGSLASTFCRNFDSLALMCKNYTKMTT